MSNLHNRLTHKAHGLPNGFLDMPLVRSYAEQDGLDMYRVEIRQHPETGILLRSKRPMPTTLRNR